MHCPPHCHPMSASRWGMNWWQTSNLKDRDDDAGERDKRINTLVQSGRFRNVQGIQFIGQHFGPAWVDGMWYEALASNQSAVPNLRHLSCFANRSLPDASMQAIGQLTNLQSFHVEPLIQGSMRVQQHLACNGIYDSN